MNDEIELKTNVFSFLGVVFFAALVIVLLIIFTSPRKVPDGVIGPRITYTLCDELGTERTIKLDKEVSYALFDFKNNKVAVAGTIPLPIDITKKPICKMIISN